MAKKFRRTRTFARTASKSMEKKLITNAEKLLENPYLLLPEYNDDYSIKNFKKIKKGLEKIQKISDNEKKLEKISNKHGIDGALAGTLLIAHAKKAPYLAVARYPTGNITYAQRGRAETEKLIAVQHFDDPLLRLMGIKDHAIRKGLHIYSWKDGYISTGLKAEPPKEFIDFIIKKTGFNLKDGIISCGDLKTEQIKNAEIHKIPYLRIIWKSAETIFGICENCTKTQKNTLFNITKYLLEPDISKDFSIDVIGEVIKKGNINNKPEIQFLNDYLSGKLSDNAFIKKNMEQRKNSLIQSEKKMLVLNGISYGNDDNAFIKALNPNDYEKRGLEFILTQIDEPVVLNEVTPNKVLENFWDKYGFDTINSIINDDEMTEKFYALDDTPSEILETVFRYKDRQKILSQLPNYNSLPPLAKFADHIARTYKTFGKKETISEIKKRPDSPKGKSIAYAFLLAFGKGKDIKWQFSQIELEYGEFLKEYAKKLLDSKPQDYHKTLQDLLTTSGASENIESNLIK